METYLNFCSTVFAYTSEVREGVAVSFVSGLLGPDISECTMKNAFRAFGCVHVASASLRPLEDAARRVRMRCSDRPGDSSLVVLSADEPFPGELRDVSPKAFVYVGDSDIDMPPENDAAIVTVGRGGVGSYRVSILRSSTVEKQYLSDAAIAVALLLGAKRVYRTEQIVSA